MNSFFKQLGKSVLQRWQNQNFSPGAFPEIARLCLEEKPPFQNVELSEFVRQFCLDDDQPFQTQSTFGQPEIVVFDSHRFYIQLLFWLDGTTDVHQHTFSGAFHVLQGSSLHSRYEFKDPEPITAHLRVGNLELKETQLLETGKTVEINSGEGFIHSLFHLDTPSVTVVIRTHNDPGTEPQFTYLPPHLAVNPLYNDALTARRKQLLDVLESKNDPTYPDMVAEMIQKLDFERGFFILQNSVGPLQDSGSWDPVWRVFERKHGRLAQFVLPSIEEIVRRDSIVALRSIFMDPQHRFFLALLLTVLNRNEFLRLIAQRFPGKPERTLSRWISELKDMADEDTDWLWEAHAPLLFSK